MSKPILVTGATGNQGGAVLEALVQQKNPEFVILALTRDAESPGAKRISAKSESVRVLQGNMDNPEQIFSNAKKLVGKPVWGVFMVQTVLAGGVTGEQEEAQGKKFIDACISNNVKALVYTSVDRGGDVRSLQDPTSVSVFASKHRIEQHLFQKANGTDLSWLVLRPTGLMEPLLRDDFVGKMVRTSWKVYMEPDKTLQWVSCKDVGHFAGQHFLNPDKWSRRCISLAGWEGTFAQANAVNKSVNGYDLSLTFSLLVRFICGVVVRDLSVSYKWYNEKGFGADIEGLRKMHPGMLSLEDYLREQTAETGH